ncbi:MULTISPECIES: phosphotransferase [unclassified Pseudodesulfovibrio]|uniref:phosphotransferase enzyme family protein n=1 Tax=unclassified Pseudodesulfovibrio TaxID=2661612 RepID=UPI000FEB993E|nr:MULTISPECIES: phosphotransferase [unclassified Pseudodesulfovibrio]MCJ2166158.1 phosphotransferase [Pseudodesulfovibrio sp. S3-i]RWU02390.1 aminoglycoside phosphotransferase family protein [Pseudodesulfovibrio sp. S3]
MTEILSLWGLPHGSPRTDISLSGSPQRCLTRSAVEDGTGRVWVLETLRPGQFDRRERIGRTLARLSSEGLPVPAYLPGPDGQFCMERDGSHYQISPFVPGDPLPQPEYIEDADRGKSLGRFLADLHRIGSTISEFDMGPRFDLENYINELMGAMGPRSPEMHDALLPVLPALVPLFEAWDDLPPVLSQGDFHPLNVIWKRLSVAAVIDWEFAGVRPALFDAANCLGCVGIEEPRALVRGLAPAMLRTLKERDCLDSVSFSLLPELLLGLRFAWMSEWLRRKDLEMIDLEVRYMRLLANSMDTLLPAWQKITG